MNKRIKDIDLNKGLFTLIYGQIGDVFIGQDTLRYSINQLLYLHLKHGGYDVVVFYDSHNSFFSYDCEDLVKLFRVEKLASTPPITGNAGWNKKNNDAAAPPKEKSFPRKKDPTGKDIFIGTKGGETLKTLKYVLEDRSKKRLSFFRLHHAKDFYQMMSLLIASQLFIQITILLKISPKFLLLSVQMIKG